MSTVGTPVTSGLPCGNINPLGITGTPIVDLSSRSLFLDAETEPSAMTFKHLIFSLNVDTGAINLGWRDPGSIDLSEYQDREPQRILFVDHAGEVLHRLSKDRPAR